MLGTYTKISDQITSVGIDIETYDPYLKISGASWTRNEGYILGIACKIDDRPAEYYPLRHISSNYDRDRVKLYFNDLFKICYENDIPIIGHYLQYDLGWLDHEGFLDINKCPPLFCTLIGSQLYNSAMMYSLKMCSKYFGVGEKIDIEVEELTKMLVQVVEKYACSDIDLSVAIYNKLLPQLPITATIRENSVLPILIMMKKNGIKIDEEKIQELDKEFEIRLNNLMNILIQHDPKIKIWSGQSIEFLFRRLGIGYPRTDHGNPSFTAAFLEEIAKISPVIKALSEARKLQKLRGTFLEGIRRSTVNGKLHPEYYNGKSDDGGTVTGRLSSANPNIQQMPSRTEEGLSIRSAFIPENLAWMRADYSQQEPRLMLHYAALLDMPTIDHWKELYENNPNQDFYDVLTELTGIHDRFKMKTNTLALSYGMGEDHMADIMSISKQEAREFKALFNERIPWLDRLNIYVQQQALQKGKIKTLGDRFLRFTQNNASKSFNHLIQGSAADQTKQAMIDIYKITGKVPLIQVHDELNYDFTEEDLEMELDTTIEQIMKDAFKLEFPVKVDVSMGNNWMECCMK